MKAKERREKIKQFASNNKLFLIIAVCLSIYLIVGIVRDDEKVVTNDNIVTEAEEQEETNRIQWRFYWSDFIVLVGGVGFCGYKIIQRNKKAKEDI